MMWKKAVLSTFALAVVLLFSLSGCGSDNDLKSDEVVEIVRDELVLLGIAPAAELSPEEINEIVAAVIAELPDNSAAMSAADVEELVERLVTDAANDGQEAIAAPSKSMPSEYTKYFVDDAIRRYEAEGLEATVAHYNDPANVDGQWYVFIADTEGQVISHFDETRRTNRLDSWLGTDINGYVFGSEMLSATEDGKWVSYVYLNPAKGDLASSDFGDAELKNAWVVRHNDLYFASGWYIDVDGFIQALVADVADAFDPVTSSPEDIVRLTGASAVAQGLTSTLDYYNSAEGRGRSLIYVADSDGRIVSAVFTPDLTALNISDVLGPAVLTATPDGTWITEADNEPDSGPAAMRIWTVSKDGYYFGAGWYDNSTP